MLCHQPKSTVASHRIASHRRGKAQPKYGVTRIQDKTDVRQILVDKKGKKGNKKIERATHTHSRAHTPDTLKHNLATRPHGHLLNQAPSRFTTSIQPRHPPKPCISASSASMPNRRVGVPLPAQLVEPKTIPAKAALGSSRHFGPVCSSLLWIVNTVVLAGGWMDGWMGGRTHAKARWWV